MLREPSSNNEGKEVSNKNAKAENKITASICEGGAESVIIDKRSDANKLIFKRDKL